MPFEAGYDNNTSPIDIMAFCRIYGIDATADVIQAIMVLFSAIITAVTVQRDLTIYNTYIYSVIPTPR